MYVIFILLAVCTTIEMGSAIPVPEIPVEIMEKGMDFVRAKFKPTKYVTEYIVSVHEEFSMENGLSMSISNITVLNWFNLADDGYHYIEREYLVSGKAYEIEVYYDKGIPIGATQFKTDCPANRYQCVPGLLNRPHYHICLEEKDLCDGKIVCRNGEDEEETNAGKCVSTRILMDQQKCTRSREAIIHNGGQKIPDCEIDGSYSSLQCIFDYAKYQYDCVCVGVFDGRILDVAFGFDYFKHSSFLDRCKLLRRANVTQSDVEQPRTQHTTTTVQPTYITDAEEAVVIEVINITTTSTTIHLTWKHVTGITSYQAYAAMVYLADAPAVAAPVVYGDKAKNNMMEATVSNLKPNNLYSVWIRSEGTVRYSDFFDVRTSE